MQHTVMSETVTKGREKKIEQIKIKEVCRSMPLLVLIQLQDIAPTIAYVLTLTTVCHR